MSVYLAPADSRLTDVMAMEGWLDDEEANLDMGYGSGENGAQRAYQSVLEALEAKTLFGVFRDQVPIGLVFLSELPTGVAQFHGVVAPRCRKTIWASRAIEAVERATLGNGTYRLETEVLCRNQRALRLLKKLGFVPEGAHKGRHLMDGKRETTMTLRLLQSDWRK